MRKPSDIYTLTKKTVNLMIKFNEITSLLTVFFEA